MIKEASVVHRMHFETVFADASNFSANITEFTATGMDAKMKRTENSSPLIFNIYKPKHAISGDKSKRTVSPDQNVV